LLTLLVLIGIVIGSLIAKNGGVQNQSSFSFFMQNAFSASTASKGFMSLLMSAFFSSSILICCAFFLGLCAVGSPAIVLILIFKGAGIGLSIGYLYMQYGLKGVAISALCILPQAVLSSVAIIIACREGLRFSVQLASVVLPTGKQLQLWSTFLEYCYKFVICFVIVFAASIIDALATTGLSGLLF
jgi:stage II sporulation protein M